MNISKLAITAGLALIVMGCDSDSNGDGDSGNDGGGGDSGNVSSTGRTGDQSTAGSGLSANCNLTHSPMTDCAGGKYDPDNDICWQDPPDETVRKLEEGIEYCESLDLAGHTDWRLPTISELRSLYRSGDDEACRSIEWTMSWSEAPEGCCRVSEECLSLECRSVEQCNPTNCGFDPENKTAGYHPRGPGNNNCYWDTALSGPCEKIRYVSSTQSGQALKPYWMISFSRTADDALYSIVAYTSDLPRWYARCMRKGK